MLRHLEGARAAPRGAQKLPLPFGLVALWAGNRSPKMRRGGRREGTRTGRAVCPGSVSQLGWVPSSRARRPGWAQGLLVVRMKIPRGNPAFKQG